MIYFLLCLLRFEKRDDIIKGVKISLYIYGVFLFLAWGFQFAINLDYYNKHDIVSGMTFICFALLYFFLCIYLYHKNTLGQKIVLYSLFVLAISSIGMLFFYDF